MGWSPDDEKLDSIKLLVSITIQVGGSDLHYPFGEPKQGFSPQRISEVFTTAAKEAGLLTQARYDTQNPLALNVC